MGGVGAAGGEDVEDTAGAEEGTVAGGAAVAGAAATGASVENGEREAAPGKGRRRAAAGPMGTARRRPRAVGAATRIGGHGPKASMVIAAADRRNTEGAEVEAAAMNRAVAPPHLPPEGAGGLPLRAGRHGRRRKAAGGSAAAAAAGDGVAETRAEEAKEAEAAAEEEGAGAGRIPDRGVERGEGVPA